MLVLTRHTGESFLIGDSIEVKLLTCREGKARIGISAPKDVEVHRREVFEKIKHQQQQQPEG